MAETDCVNLITIFIEAIIAAGAIITVFLAFRAYRLSRESLRIQENSKRSWLVPPSLPGSIEKIPGKILTVNKVKIHLKNFGTNPASNINAKLLIYGSDSNNKIIQIEDPTVCNNPIAHNSVFNIEYDISQHSQAIAFVPKYVVVLVDYLDIILNEEFSNNIFYWNVSSINSDNISTLLEIRSENKENFFNTIKDHNPELYKLLL
ncbi:hypothetical protein KKF86_07415 [bacterium]|nr:hypothetical protein [bacterium]